MISAPASPVAVEARAAEVPTSLLRTLRSPLRSALALPGAAAAFVAGAAHVPVLPEHLRDVPYVGYMFVALVAVCAVGAIVLAISDLVVGWLVLSVSAFASVALYLLSRGPGMPGMDDDIGDWTNQLGLISIASESLLVLLALLALNRASTIGSSTRRLLILSIPVAGLLLAAAGYGIGLTLT